MSTLSQSVGAVAAAFDQGNKTTSTLPPLPLRVAALRPRLESTVRVPATILSRSAATDTPTYSLRLGSVDIPDVSLEELFEYVSPHDLEVFENTLFKHEIEAETAIQIAKRDARNKNRELRWLKKQNAIINGAGVTNVNSRYSISWSSSGSVSSEADGDEQHGSGRRPRPTYTHMFKPTRAKRGSAGLGHGNGLAHARGMVPSRTTTSVVIPSPVRKPLARKATPEIAQSKFLIYINAVNILTNLSSSRHRNSRRYRLLVLRLIQFLRRRRRPVLQASQTNRTLLTIHIKPNSTTHQRKISAHGTKRNRCSKRPDLSPKKSTIVLVFLISKNGHHQTCCPLSRPPLHPKPQQHHLHRLRLRLRLRYLHNRAHRTTRPQRPPYSRHRTRHRTRNALPREMGRLRRRRVDVGAREQFR